jgi:hypothetical protein
MPQNRTSIVIDYASPVPSKKRRKAPISGVVSLIAMVLQYPWGLAWFFIAWGDQGPTGNGPTPGTADFYLVMMVLPTILGFAFGCYSIWAAGIESRNACGVIGLSLVAGELIWYLPEWIWSSTQIVLVFQLGIVVLLSVVIASVLLWAIRRWHHRNERGEPNGSNESGLIVLRRDASLRRRLFGVVFTALAAISAQMFFLWPNHDWKGETRVWNWSEAQKQVVGKTFVPPGADPRYRSVIEPLAPGVRIVRVGEPVLSGGTLFQDDCYVGVATPVLLPSLAILPAAWLFLALRRRLSPRRGE